MGKRLDLIRRMLLGLLLLAPLALTVNAGAAGLEIDEPAPALFSDLTPAQRQALEDSLPTTAEPYVLRWRPATVQRDLLGSARGQGAVQTAAAAVRIARCRGARRRSAKRRPCQAGRLHPTRTGGCPSAR